jgi:hypothetical protein
MTDVTFYYQERFDGGRRAGLWYDDYHFLHSFIEGSEEFDSRLQWYVNVVIPTEDPPSEENALRWLVSHLAQIRRALTATAKILESGIDCDAIPWETSIPDEQGPMTVRIAAARHAIAGKISEKLNALAATSVSSLFSLVVVPRPVNNSLTPSNVDVIGPIEDETLMCMFGLATPSTEAR